MSAAGLSELCLVSREFWSHASGARAALERGDAAAARHHLLRLALAEPSKSAPRGLARLVERRRRRALLELAEIYLRQRAPAAPARLIAE